MQNLNLYESVGNQINQAHRYNAQATFSQGVFSSSIPGIHHQEREVARGQTDSVYNPPTEIKIDLRALSENYRKGL